MSLTPEEMRARFERSLQWAGPTHTVENVLERVREGRAQFWHSDDGAIVSEVVEFPLVKTINFWLIAGTLPGCVALEPRVLEFARDVGCEVATGTGRPGWGSVPGWRRHSYNFVKPLTKDFARP